MNAEITKQNEAGFASQQIFALHPREFAVIFKLAAGGFFYYLLSAREIFRLNKIPFLTTKFYTKKGQAYLSFILHIYRLWYRANINFQLKMRTMCALHFDYSDLPTHKKK